MGVAVVVGNIYIYICVVVCGCVRVWAEDRGQGRGGEGKGGQGRPLAGMPSVSSLALARAVVAF